MDVREKIAERCQNAYAAGYGEGRKGRNRLEHRVNEVAQSEADRIIAIIREAILSEQAVEALHEAIPAYMDGDELHDGVKAALAAAGLGGQGE